MGGALTLIALFALLAAVSSQTLPVVIPILGAVIGWFGWTVRPILRAVHPYLAARQRPGPVRPERHSQGQESLDIPTALWTLAIYLSLGWLPGLLLP